MLREGLGNLKSCSKRFGNFRPKFRLTPVTGFWIRTFYFRQFFISQIWVGEKVRSEHTFCRKLSTNQSPFSPTCHLLSTVSVHIERYPSKSKDHLSIKEVRQIFILRTSFEVCELSFEPRNLFEGYIVRATVTIRKIRILRLGESFEIIVRNSTVIFRTLLILRTSIIFRSLSV